MAKATKKTKPSKTLKPFKSSKKIEPAPVEIKKEITPVVAEEKIEEKIEEPVIVEEKKEYVAKAWLSYGNSRQIAPEDTCFFTDAEAERFLMYGSIELKK